jgi:hypothetical protein
MNMQGKGWDVKEGSSRRDLKREDRSRRPLLLMTSWRCYLLPYIGI